MGALVMFGLVSTIAIIGVIYFLIKRKRSPSNEKIGE